LTSRSPSSDISYDLFVNQATWEKLEWKWPWCVSTYYAEKTENTEKIKNFEYGLAAASPEISSKIREVLTEYYFVLLSKCCFIALSSYLRHGNALKCINYFNDKDWKRTTVSSLTKHHKFLRYSLKANTVVEWKLFGAFVHTLKSL
jgi:hypothetical protein